MTLIITTTNHGDIQGGFYSVYTGAFRFGKFVFPTQTLHAGLRRLAENPELNAINLPSFEKSVFWEGFSDHAVELMARSHEVSHSWLPDLAESEFERFIDECQGKMTGVEITQAFTTVPVRVSHGDSGATFGNYRLDVDNFRGLVSYAVGGGFYGWNNNAYPSAAERAKEAILASKRPLFARRPALKQL